MNVMRICWKLFWKVMLVHLFPLFYGAFAQVTSNMINMMAASKATGARTVLMLSNTDTERIYPQVNELPTAVKFVPVTGRAIGCEFYGHYRKQDCGISAKQMYDFVGLPRIAYLPFISSIPHFKQGWIMDLSMFRRVQFVISSEVHNKTLRQLSPHELCNVVSVSSRDVNAPVDRYRKCDLRVNVTASELFAADTASPSANKFPKGENYTAAMQHLRSTKGDIDIKPEALAMIDALRVLNNTVEVTEVPGAVAVMKKSIDMVLIPVTTALLANKELFEHTYYPPVRYCFFSRRRVDIRMAFVVSSKSFLKFLKALALAGTSVALCVHTRSRVPFRGRTLLTLPGFLLFMVGTFFGRCHTIPETQAPSYRSLAVVSWILGMLFLGSYVQTSITATRVVPSVSASVRTLEELEPLIKTCAMAPCFNHVWGDVLSSISIDGFGAPFRELGQSVLYCRNIYFTPGDIAPCYAKAQVGSHVALSTCSDQEVSAASQWGLAPSNDLFTFPQMFTVHWQNPARYQYRRLLIAIAEHGLAVPHRKRVLPQMTDEDNGAESFVLYFGVYLAGCALSCAALAAELLCRFKQRRRVGDNRQPRLLAPRSD